MKILVFGNGTLSVAHQEIKICSTIAELGHQVYLVLNPKPKLFDVGKVFKHPNLHIMQDPEHRYNPQIIQDAGIEFDACLGMDQSVSPFVSEFKNNYKHVYSACLFLDYPVHVVDDSSSQNYSFDYSQRYYYWINCALEIDTIIFNNTVAVEYFKKKYKRDSKLVWYCITEDKFLDTYDSIKEDYVVACNRLILYKGTDYLVDALARTDYQYKHISVSGNLTQRFKDRCIKSMPDRSELYERCAEDKKMQLIADAKIVVYPQITEWIGGLSIIEGMSVKTPGVCFDYPVLKELYADCVLYSRRKSALDLRKNIKELWNNAGLYRDLQQRGYERFKKYFTKKIMAENLVKVLEE